MNLSEKENQTDAQFLRMRAEKKFRERQQTTDAAASEQDATKLLHELQVHQIELEMQNEELRLANEATEMALKRYTMLYDLAPMGFFTLEPDGTIVELNFTAAEMLADRRFSLIESNFKLFVSDESKAVFNEFFRNVLANISKQSCEIKLGYDKNPLAYVYMEGVFISDENKCLLSVMDISGLKK
jgi:PAS domain-containing protein